MRNSFPVWLGQHPVQEEAPSVPETPVCACLSESVRGGTAGTALPAFSSISRILPSSLLHCSPGDLKLVSSLALPFRWTVSFAERVNLNLTCQKMVVFYPLT